MHVEGLCALVEGAAALLDSADTWDSFLPVDSTTEAESSTGDVAATEVVVSSVGLTATVVESTTVAVLSRLGLSV